MNSTISLEDRACPHFRLGQQTELTRQANHEAAEAKQEIAILKIRLSEALTLLDDLVTEAENGGHEFSNNIQQRLEDL